MIYYYDQPVAEYIKTPRATVIMKNFNFYFNPHFKMHQNALSILLTQVQYNVTIDMSDCSFSNLQNFTVLNYYGTWVGAVVFNCKPSTLTVKAVLLNCSIALTTSNPLKPNLTYSATKFIVTNLN